MAQRWNIVSGAGAKGVGIGLERPDKMALTGPGMGGYKISRIAAFSINPHVEPR
jgi:hypothetical protein